MSIDTRAVELQEAIDLVEGLTAALRTRSSIACAKGIIMERYGLGPDEAIDVLHDTARRNDREVVAVAERIIAGESVDAVRHVRPRSGD